MCIYLRDTSLNNQISLKYAYLLGQLLFVQLFCLHLYLSPLVSKSKVILKREMTRARGKRKIMRWKPSKAVQRGKHWIGDILLRTGSPHKRQTIKYKYTVQGIASSPGSSLFAFMFPTYVGMGLAKMVWLSAPLYKMASVCENPSLISCLNAHSFVLKKTITFLLSSEALAEYLIGFLSRKFYTIKIMNYELPTIFPEFI